MLDPVFAKMSADEAEAARQLICDLFPRVHAAYGGAHFGSDWLATWARERRASSPEYCPRYFTYAIPSGDIADADIGELVTLAAEVSVDNLGRALERYLTQQTAGRLIEKLRTLEGVIEEQAATTLAVALARIGGKLPSVPTLFSWVEPYSQAAILISNLIHQVGSSSARVTLARQVLQEADPVWFGVECIRWMHVTNKEDRQEANTLSAEQRDDVRRVLVDRVKALAKDGDPLFDPSAREKRSMLYEWTKVEGREPVQAHLIAVFERDCTQVARFLEASAGLVWGGSSPVPRVGEVDADVVESIDFLIDLDILAVFVRRCCQGNLDDPAWIEDPAVPLERRLAEQFMYVYRRRAVDTDSEARAASAAPQRSE